MRGNYRENLEEVERGMEGVEMMKMQCTCMKCPKKSLTRLIDYLTKTHSINY